MTKHRYRFLGASRVVLLAASLGFGHAQRAAGIHPDTQKLLIDKTQGFP
jgi:hypothetical protein